MSADYPDVLLRTPENNFLEKSLCEYLMVDIHETLRSFLFQFWFI
jgi:hypothetical protein